VERTFKVNILQTDKKYSGFGMTKFGAHFSNLSSFLLLDADTVFLGKVLDELENYDDDFIVTGVDVNTESWVVKRDYINIEKVK
jgi:hypothetical protein